MYKKIYLKITTVPSQLENFDIDSKEIQIFQSKYESHKGFLSDTDTELAYLNEASTNGSFARLYSITLGFVYNDTVVAKTLKGEEKDLLNKLLEILTKEDKENGDFRNAMVVMYNRSFVLSFLSKRFRKHGINISRLPISLNSYEKKPWTIKGSKCLQEFVKGISYQTENFEESCMIHNIDCDIIDSSLISRQIRNGKDIKAISDSDLNYMKAMVQLDRQLSEEPPIDKYQGVVQRVGETLPEKVNVLDHIVSAGTLNKKSINAIVEHTKENNLNPENVVTLVTAALSHSATNNKVDVSELDELKEELGLTQPTDLIGCVVEKKSIGKKQAQELINQYSKATIKVRKEVVKQVENYIEDLGKQNQVRVKNSIEFLKEQLFK